MLETLPVGPGARYDILFDLPDRREAEARIILRGGEEPDRPLLVFKTEGEARPRRPAIASLAVNPLLPTRIKLQNSKRVDLVIEPAKEGPAEATGRRPFWALNGVAQDQLPGEPMFSVKRGSPVTLAIINRSAFAQQIHVHGHHVRLLHDLDDGWEPYWRDCVLVAAGKTKRLAFIADNQGKWVIESFVAERQTSGLSTWFLVT
jgi:FtsP/CotA-like multicopper oxidase with cupredoxin domain